MNNNNANTSRVPKKPLNTEQRFYLRVFFMCIVGIIMISGIIAGCLSYETNKISKLIENGNDPMSVKCALNGENNKGILCQVYFISKSNKEKYESK